MIGRWRWLPYPAGGSVWRSHPPAGWCPRAGQPQRRERVLWWRVPAGHPFKARGAKTLQMQERLYPTPVYFRTRVDAQKVTST
jgi:hypothetical protein